ncbi:hypothetical protein SK128_012723 [Halocaridina rubra]|uniref:Uncharacterized protein n=1 Tax=Halocaridina rubra TaxID=373956 RepID=A0AAN8X072_HALRR
MNRPVLSILIWIFILFLHDVTASHFRGGLILINPTETQNPGEVEIEFTVSWSRTSSEGGDCDQDVIASGASLGYGDIECMAGCSGNVVPAIYQCTAFSIRGDWSQGYSRQVHTFVTGNGIVTIGFTDCCWSTSSDWNLVTTFSPDPRSDTGVINSTPRPVTSLNLRLLAGCNHTIAIPVTDPDNDIVRCRWASGYNECGTVCNFFPNAILDEETCTLQYEAIYGPGLYTVAIMVEDFLPGSNTPLSSVALQFMVEVFSSAASCSSVPQFLPPTIAEGKCLAIPPNSTFTTQMLAYSGKPGAQVVEFNTIAPDGLYKSSVYPDEDPNEYYVILSWAPDPSQYYSIHTLCYSALNSLDLASPQFCFQLIPGVYAPYIIQSSLLPTYNETIMTGHNNLHFEFSQPIRRPERSARMFINDYDTDGVLHVIDIHNSSEVLIYNESHVSFNPDFNFPECKSMYITFEEGAFVGFACYLESLAITDKDFWVFHTPCATKKPCVKRSRCPCKQKFTDLLSDVLCDDDDDDDDFPCDCHRPHIDGEPCNDVSYHLRKGHNSPTDIRNQAILRGERNIVIQDIDL